MWNITTLASVAWANLVGENVGVGGQSRCYSMYNSCFVDLGILACLSNTPWKTWLSAPAHESWLCNHKYVDYCNHWICARLSWSQPTWKARFYGSVNTSATARLGNSNPMTWNLGTKYIERCFMLIDAGYLAESSFGNGRWDCAVPWKPGMSIHLCSCWFVSDRGSLHNNHCHRCHPVSMCTFISFFGLYSMLWNVV